MLSTFLLYLVLTRVPRVQYYVPKVKTGHVAPEVPLARVKDRLAHVKGALVECPLVRTTLILRYVAYSLRHKGLLDR